MNNINQLDNVGGITICITIIVVAICITTTIIVNIYTDQQFAVSAVNAGLQQCSINEHYPPLWRKACPDNK
jgi:hypothetical protein